MEPAAVDNAVLLQNRKFRRICSNLVSKCSARSNKENKYPHSMFLSTNNDCYWEFKVTRPCTCIRHCRLASPRVNEPYAHRRRACDSRNYRRVIVEIKTYRSMEVLHGVSM